MDHGKLDEICRASLDGRVDGDPFSKLSRVCIFGVDFLHFPLSAEKGLHLPGLPGGFHGLVYKSLDACVPFEIVVNIQLRHLPGNSQIPGKLVCAHAVDDPEVDRLGLPPEIIGHKIRDHLEHLDGGPCMDVLVVHKRIHEDRVLCTMSQDPQLDLGIVRGKEHRTLLRHERLPDFPALLAAHRDILQVRVGTAQPSRGCDALVERGMNPARFRVDQFAKGVRIRGLELGKGPVPKQESRQFVIPGKCGQHIHVSGIPFGFPGFFHHRQSELFKQDHTELLRRIDVELFARSRVDIGLDPFKLVLKGFGQLVDFFPVNFDPGDFHPGQHRQKGHFHIVHQGFQTIRPDSFGEFVVRHQREIRVFAGIFICIRNPDLVKPFLLFSLSGDLLVGKGFVPEKIHCDLVQAVAPCGRIHKMGCDHGVEYNAVHFDPAVRQHDVVIFDVLADLFDGLTFQNGLEDGQYLLFVRLSFPILARMSHRNVHGAVFLPCNGNAHKFGPDRLG